MIDWTASMSQTFEYYFVNPKTWYDDKRLNTIKSCSITRDSEAESLGSATLDVDGQLDEGYVRVYMLVSQNGVRERIPLATVLAQTPSSSFDGKIGSTTVDAYTPLIELKEDEPPLGFTILKDRPNGQPNNIMENACNLIKEHTRAPLVKATDIKLQYSHFTANTDDTWLSFLLDYISSTDYSLDVDPMGSIMFAKKQKVDSMQPIWTYTDDNSSILLPDLNFDHDIYGIPNVVEVVFSDENHLLYSKVVNDDINSPTSLQSRGRTITKRIVNPDLGGVPNQSMLDKYAVNALKELSSVDYKVSYTHGYCPVKMGDCVLMNYKKADINNVKAKVISQTIKCETGCTVTEKAIFTNKLWR